jgi:hypothetical protein
MAFLKKGRSEDFRFVTALLTGMPFKQQNIAKA